TASIAANAEVEGMVRRRVPALARRLRTIAIGSNVKQVGAAADGAGRRLLGVAPAAPLLVHFGLIYPGKGLETLLQAFATLPRRRHGGDRAAAQFGRARRPARRAARRARAARATARGSARARGTLRVARDRGADAAGLRAGGGGMRILVLTPTFLPVMGGAEM